MNKTLSTAIQLIVFAAVAAVAIYYIFNRSPVEVLGDYEKREMVKPNRDKSALDQFFSPPPSKREDTSGDGSSLSGSAGRYDEVRIGKSTEE